MTMRLCSTNGEVTDSSNLGGYKSNSKKFCTETNHLKSLCKTAVQLETNLNSLRKI